MKKITFILILFCIFPALSFGADSASNRADQTLRLGTKSGLPLMYLLAQPFMLELPGKDWTFGVSIGSGTWSQDVTTSSGTTSSEWTITTQELNARYYVGNSFNILLSVKMKVANPEAVVKFVINVALPIFMITR